MHLYIHEFDNPEDNKIKEVKNLLFENSLKDYQIRTDTKIRSAVIKLNSHGKPYFADNMTLHFSISHSGRYWVCMFDTENVGVDIEDLSKRNMSAKRLNEIATRFFADDEREYVYEDISDTDNEAYKRLRDRFFRIWTAKESYLKYTGNGFSEGLTTFSVLDSSMEVSFRDVPVDSQAVLTICSRKTVNIDGMIIV